MLYAVQRSLGTPEDFAGVKTMFANPLVSRAARIVWAYLHHFCAGIRYLLIDLHVGDDLVPARRSSVVVLVISIALTLIIAVRMW
jgi:succinate dehydrogenase / fumarate reductase cytochrome b subunit